MPKKTRHQQPNPSIHHPIESPSLTTDTRCDGLTQCPRVVALLAESYNPHMRYGAAMAVGIACAGTGLKEAIALLEPLTIDAVDYVRQGALIAMAMVLVQQTEAPRVTAFRKQVCFLEKLWRAERCQFEARAQACMRDVKKITLARTPFRPFLRAKSRGFDQRERSEFPRYQTYQCYVRVVVLGVLSRTVFWA